MREALREMLEANHRGETAPVAARTLAGLSGESPIAYEVTPEGEIRLNLDPAPDVSGLIGQILGIINQAQTTDQWPRLGICAAETCRWAFYDTSKNRGGTWCRMEVCGNRTKNRRYRSKA
jgi:predicted RNA-binding Zn ribbon-like protein